MSSASGAQTPSSSLRVYDLYDEHGLPVILASGTRRTVRAGLEVRSKVQLAFLGIVMEVVLCKDLPAYLYYMFW